MFEEVRDALPHIPEEVIRLWIIPLSAHENNGWPPTARNRWDERVSGETFAFWNDAEWEKQNVNLSTIPYSRGYFDTMQGLKEAYQGGVRNSFYELLGEDGRMRFGRLLIYILQNRLFPQPPIMAINEIGTYEILDGNHRFFAYVSAEAACTEYNSLADDQKESFRESLSVEELKPPQIRQNELMGTGTISYNFSVIVI